MKLCSIHIKDYQQFQDTFLDFTHPETKEPLDKICFIGPNGTGKSTILWLLNNLNPYSKNHSNLSNGKLLVLKYIHRTKNYYQIVSPSYKIKDWVICENEQDVQAIVKSFDGLTTNSQLHKRISMDIVIATVPKAYQILFEKHKANWPNRNWQSSESDAGLLIYCPAESKENLLLTINDVPKATLDEANKLFKSFENHHQIDFSTSSGFWQILMYHTSARKAEKEQFENQKENLSKTKQQLNEEFANKHPKILDSIATIWNNILDKANLEFDVINAKEPIQLSDNLNAYIKLKGSNGQSNNIQRIPYRLLSTGIRNFIFRIGHIHSLYFNRQIDFGTLLVDEPENSLFPDFLYDLIDLYQQVTTDKNGTRNTQSFFATHSPIVAAQFAPYERIILDWDLENPGTVLATKGQAPEGDDPNDVLKKDFGIRNLMGEKGNEMWKEYLRLKHDVRVAKDDKEKMELSKRISQIGSDYNFES